MEITLKRLISNHSCTTGVLQFGKAELCTLEGRMPKDGRSNIGWLLPPGEYLLDVEYSAMMVNGKLLHGFWPNFQRVPWFPHAMFLSSKPKIVNKGRIAIGMVAADEFSLLDHDGATMKLAGFCNYYHSQHGNEPLTLRIIEDRETMTFHDYTEAEYHKMVAEEELIEAQNDFQRQLNNFSDYE